MESKLLKLMAQFGLLAILIWVLASALGQRDQVMPKTKSNCRGRKQRAKGDVWARSPVQGRGAQMTFAPTLQMGLPNYA